MMAVLSLTACNGSQGSSAPTPQDSYVVAVGLTNNGTGLDILSVGAVVAGNVNVIGLDVDMGCAGKQAFDSSQDIRIELLNDGCARLVGATRDPQEEQAQQAAKSAGKGIWSPSIGAKIARLWAAFLRWLARNWLTILAVISFLLALASVPWFFKWSEQRKIEKYQRRVRIVLAGVGGAGKTDLWIAWRDGLAPKSDSAPTVGTKPSIANPVRYGEFTLLPTVVDVGGPEPWELARQLKIMDETAGARRGHIRRILVFVLSPCPQNRINGSSPIDEDYIAQQKGYASLPMAIVGGDDVSIRPHMVIMFVSKFDLVSTVAPWDTNGTTAREDIEKRFREHRRLIEAACGRHGVRFTSVIGSAKTGWGVSELQNAIREVINGQ
jgi:hypothetical protein